MHGAGLVYDVGLVLTVAAITGLVFRLLRRPSVLGYLLTGLLVGPYLPVPLFADVERVHALSEFGVVLVMFAIGLEFRIRKLVQILPVAGVTGLVQMATMFWVGISLGRVFGWNSTESLFLGAAITISSTMIVSKVLAEGHMASHLRDFILGILVIQDVAAIVLIAVMTAVAKGTGLALPAIAWTVTKLVMVLGALGGIGLVVIPRLTRRVIALGSRETLVVYACGVCFGFALLAEHLGYSVALGAFLAGILLSESGRGEVVSHRVEPLRDVFAAIFFVSIGMTVDPRLILEHLPLALAVFGGVTLGQIVSVTLGGVLSGAGLDRSVSAGLVLGPIGEFSFIIAAVGMQAHIVKPELAPVLVMASVLGALSTPWTARLAEPLVAWIQGRLPARMERALVLYETWFQRLRASKNPLASARLRKLILSLCIDVGGLVAGTFAWTRISRPLEQFAIDRVGLHELAGYVASGMLLFLLTAPFILVLVRNTRRLASESVLMVFGVTDAPRTAERVFRTGLGAVVTIVAALVVAGALRSFLSHAIVLPVLVSTVALGLIRLWSSTTELDQEIKSGVREILELIEHRTSTLTGTSTTLDEPQTSDDVQGVADDTRGVALTPHEGSREKSVGLQPPGPQSPGWQPPAMPLPASQPLGSQPLGSQPPASQGSELPLTSVQAAASQPREEPSGGTPDLALHNAPELGLPNLSTVLLTRAAFAVGRTLAEIGLRAATGASVIAIQRKFGDVIVPTGAEPLAEGDRLLLAGEPGAANLASHYLEMGPSVLE